MRIERHFTATSAPLQSTDTETASGGVAYRSWPAMIGEESIGAGFVAPAHWSATAVAWLAQHARYRGSIATRLKSVGASHIPNWLWRHCPDREACAP